MRRLPSQCPHQQALQVYAQVKGRQGARQALQRHLAALVGLQAGGWGRGRAGGGGAGPVGERPGRWGRGRGAGPVGSRRARRPPGAGSTAASSVPGEVPNAAAAAQEPGTGPQIRRTWPPSATKAATVSASPPRATCCAFWASITWGWGREQAGRATWRSLGCSFVCISHGWWQRGMQPELGRRAAAPPCEAQEQPAGAAPASSGGGSPGGGSPARRQCKTSHPQFPTHLQELVKLHRAAVVLVHRLQHALHATVWVSGGGEAESG